MAFPTAVNSQITDAVIPANTKIIAEAPAMAISAIYQTIAHSTGILFENAVAAQQQQNTLALAAANMGVMQIYSIDTAATAAATDKVTQTGLAENLASLLTVLNAFRGERVTATPEAVQASGGEVDAQGARDHKENEYAGLADAVKDAVRFSNDTVLGHADGFNAALRQSTDSFVYALQQIQHAQEEALRRVLLDAAMAAALKAMLQEPQHAKAYEEVLQAIKRMG
jgi:hypothetical protein